MSALVAWDDGLLRRLPLPLAQLYRRAVNSKTPLERHLNSFCIAEAAIKLLASAAVVVYARRPDDRPELAERLRMLARPSLGHWWEIARALLPVLAERGEAGYPAVRDLVLGGARDDLPRVAGLVAAIRAALGSGGGGRASVRPAELLDEVIRHRNKVIGHANPAGQDDAFHERMAGCWLLGLGELFAKLDVLAGRQLVHVGEVRQAGGVWLVQRYELAGEAPRRQPALELPRDAASQLPDGDRLYLADAARPDDVAALTCLSPLLIHDADSGRVLFLNSRRGQRGTEYLCYCTGAVRVLADAGREQRQLLAAALGMPVGEAELSDWQERSQAGEGEAPAEPGDDVGTRWIGEYELLSELGRGGMGVVYRARQPSLGRQVALKKLLLAGDAKADARFRREVRALGRVEHPHLVKVHTSGADGEHFYYTMELVEGATLSAVCERLSTQRGNAATVDRRAWQVALSSAHDDARRAEKPLSEPAAPTLPPVPARPAGGVAAGGDCVRQLVELICQVAGAAHALHEAGVIHRDIKPGNILVTPDGSQAVLMDLGLAQLADDVEGRLTRTRQFVGTLRYASPEQVLSVGDLDRRSDVYSLGATLWELLALRPLYGADDQTPTPELMRRIQYQEPGRLRPHNPAVSRDLEAIVLKCLEKDCTARYHSAAELAEDLEHYLRGEPVQARPVGNLERGWRWCKRNALVSSLLAAVFVLMAAGTGVSWLLAARAENEASEALRLKEEAERAQESEAREAKAARAAARLARCSAYDAGMLLTQAAWEQHDVRRFLQLLEQHRPRKHGDEDFRGFEWYYWQRQFQRGQVTLKGHTRSVRSVTFSTDGKRIASGSHDGTVKVWDAQNGQETLTLKGHTDSVSSVAFSPDGKRIASGSYDNTVKVWDATSGQETRTLKGHTNPVTSVAFSPDGKHIASGSYDRTVNLWDAQTGQETRTLKGHPETVTSVTFSTDGKRIASGSHDGTVKVWDAQNGQETLTLKGHTNFVLSVAFSPDGKRIASGSEDKTMKVWDATSGQETLTLKGHTDPVTSVAFSPDGKRIASGSKDKTVKLWGTQTGQETLTLKGHINFVDSVAFSPDGTRIASGSEDRTVKMWNVQTGQETLTLHGHTDWVNSVAFSPDGKHIASGSGDKTVKLWDAQTGKETRTLKGDTRVVFGGFTSVAFSPDGKRIASGSGDNTVKVWDAQSGRETLTLIGHTHSVAFSPDGKRIASGSGDMTVKLWDAQTGQETLTLKGATDSVAFSPDGKRIASGSGDDTVKVWDATSGLVTLTLKGHTARVTSVAFSPDGKRIASGSWDHTVKVWDATSGLVTLTLKGHTNFVLSVAFSPDGKRIASGSEDKTVKLWDAQASQETLTLQGHTDPVTSVAFSPDGERIASGSKDDTVKVWDATSGEEAVPPGKSED